LFRLRMSINPLNDLGLQTHLFSYGNGRVSWQCYTEKVRGLWAVVYVSGQWGTWTGSEQGGWGTWRWGAWAESEQVGGCGQGPSMFVECAKGCSRPPSSRQPLRAGRSRGARGAGICDDSYDTT
jgi:hypothetical protein